MESTSSYLWPTRASSGCVKRSRSESDNEANGPLRKRHAHAQEHRSPETGYSSHGFTSINPPTTHADIGKHDYLDIKTHDDITNAVIGSTLDDSAVGDECADDDADDEESDVQVFFRQSHDKFDKQDKDDTSIIRPSGDLGAVSEADDYYDMQKPAANEHIVHFCQRMGYVPAGTSIPSGTRMQLFFNLKPVRRLDCNRSSTAHPWHPNAKTNSNWYALLTQVSGRPAQQPCTRCARGTARWVPCVVPPTPETWAAVNGACACCLYNNQGSTCSFTKDARRVPSISGAALAPNSSLIHTAAPSGSPVLSIHEANGNAWRTGVRTSTTFPGTSATSAFGIAPVPNGPPVWGAPPAPTGSAWPRPAQPPSSAAPWSMQQKENVRLPPISALMNAGSFARKPSSPAGLANSTDAFYPGADKDTRFASKPSWTLRAGQWHTASIENPPPPGTGRDASFAANYSFAAKHESSAFDNNKPAYDHLRSFASPPPTRHGRMNEPTSTPAWFGRYHHQPSYHHGFQHHDLEAEKEQIRKEEEQDQMDGIVHDMLTNGSKFGELAAEQCRLLTRFQIVYNSRGR